MQRNTSIQCEVLLTFPCDNKENWIFLEIGYPHENNVYMSCEFDRIL